MKVFEIKDDTIQYNNLSMKKSKIISFEGKEYIEFINFKEHIFIVMEKISEDACIDVIDDKLKNRLIEENLKKPDNFVE